MAAGVSNPLGLVVLAFLQERPMHPYELGRLLKSRNKQERSSTGTRRLTWW